MQYYVFVNQFFSRHRALCVTHMEENELYWSFFISLSLLTFMWTITFVVVFPFVTGSFCGVVPSIWSLSLLSPRPLALSFSHIFIYEIVRRLCNKMSSKVSIFSSHSICVAWTWCCLFRIEEAIYITFKPPQELKPSLVLCNFSALFERSPYDTTHQ